MNPAHEAAQRDPESSGLRRELGLGGATALNMIDMIGVGPFITIPLMLGAMGGPQAMLGWILGAVFAACDGLVWAELGAAMPGSGGTYRYLREIYGARRLGRMLSFLYVWQVSFSAPLSIASGCVGLAQYAVSVAVAGCAEMALPAAAGRTVTRGGRARRSPFSAAWRPSGCCIGRSGRLDNSQSCCGRWWRERWHG